MTLNKNHAKEVLNVADIVLSGLDYHQDHMLVNSNGDIVKVYGVDPNLTLGMYEFVITCVIKFLAKRNYTNDEFSFEQFDRLYELSLTHLWRSMNYHEYGGQPSESKLMARVLYYWLRHKPIHVRLTGQTEKDDVFCVNERFASLLVYAFVGSHVCETPSAGCDCVDYTSFIAINGKRIKDLEYHFYKHTVTLNSIEEYIESLTGIICDFCPAA
jgi:hypothetical protein